jgi:hypothetical protein
MTRSLGQPHTFTFSSGVGTGWYFQRGDGQPVVEARVGTYRDLVNPVTSLLGVQAEGYVGTRDTAFDGGGRIQVVSPYMRLGVGLDYNLLDGGPTLLLSVHHPIRRGGLFGDGSVLRVNYMPSRENSFTVGLDVPIRRRIPMGKTRARRSYVPLTVPRTEPVPDPDPRLGLDVPFARMWDAAHWIGRFIVPFVDHDGLARREANERFAQEIMELRARLRGGPSGGSGRTPAEEVDAFHDALEHAFSIAVGGRPLVPEQVNDLGMKTATEARRILLDEVLLPYDRLLGQVKREDTIRDFGARARGIFVRWLHTESGIPESRFDTVLRVFTGILDIVEDNRATIHEAWDDSRFVWLPLQYALRPEEHDTQTELDRLLEKAVGETFSEGNQVSWVVNEQFQFELSRMIHEAEDYHVLWSHDFRGYDRDGFPDEMSYRQVLHSYLAAMTARVRAYDRTGKFPVYMIFLDEWYYQVNGARLWMELLEDPTHHRLDLPRGFEAWEDSIAVAQSELREAIEESGLLQAQKGQFGEDWLRELVRVHVSVTNPGDPSFWSRGVIPVLGLPDNLMRDHRKIAFYDVGEDDPYRGEVVYTGAGVGEHYASLAWEDRSVLVRGPAALGVKEAARDLLLTQGIPHEEIPYHLQPRPLAPEYPARVRAAAGQDGLVRALEIHNQTGFHPKQINIAKALLYTLMPPGSVMKIPDSLWNSSFWGSMLLGSALRGGRILVIAPSDDNAPSSGFAQLGRAQELLYRLILSRELLGEEIASAGGLLRVGIFNPQREVTDIAGKFNSVVSSLDSIPWMRDLYDFRPSVYDAFGDVAEALQALDGLPPGPSEFQYEPEPKLHMKVNFFASREAWEGLMSDSEWAPVMSEYVQQRAAQVLRRPEALSGFSGTPEATIDVGGHMVRTWLERLDEEAQERVVFFSLMGSQNQNYRSMIMDGEVAFVAAHWPAVVPYMDLVSIVSQSRWFDDPDDLAELLPEYSEWRRRLGRWIKIAL